MTRCPSCGGLTAALFTGVYCPFAVPPARHCASTRLDLGSSVWRFVRVPPGEMYPAWATCAWNLGDEDDEDEDPRRSDQELSVILARRWEGRDHPGWSIAELVRTRAPRECPSLAFVRMA